ncbi:MAG: hypothetical protein ACYC5Y_04540 [Symbiobacteriia bacterium]
MNVDRVNRRWFGHLVLAALLPAIGLAGCGRPQAVAPQPAPVASQSSSTLGTNTLAGDPGYIPDLAPPEYKATSVDDLREHAPFPLNIPGYLPAGYALNWGMARPAFEINPAAVTMNFAAAGQSDIAVLESRDKIGYQSHPAATSMRTSSVQLGSVTAEMQTWINVGGAVNFIICFQAKGLYHIVNATGVPEAEVLRVAESLCN